MHQVARAVFNLVAEGIKPTEGGLGGEEIHHGGGDAALQVDFIKHGHIGAAGVARHRLNQVPGEQDLPTNKALLRGEIGVRGGFLNHSVGPVVELLESPDLDIVPVGEAAWRLYGHIEDLVQIGTVGSHTLHVDQGSIPALSALEIQQHRHNGLGRDLDDAGGLGEADGRDGTLFLLLLLLVLL